VYTKPEQIMKTPALLPAVAVCVAILAATCSEPPSGTDNPPVGKTEVKVSGVSLDKTKMSLVAGESGTLAMLITPSSADNKTVAWSAAPSGIVTVDGGVVAALKMGTATVTVTTVDGGYTATCTVSVAAGAVAVNGVTLDREELTLEAEGQDVLTAKVTPLAATNKAVAWTSSAPDVVKVDSDGKITALRAGSKAVITVTTQDGKKTAECVVTVAAPDPLNILRTTNIPDPVFFDYCRKQLSRWDTNKDGKLYADEARAVKSIDVANVYGTAIGSLAGIEYFTGITYLNCSLNNLTSLDVSRNTALTELNCNNNLRLTSLDVSGFTALGFLNCSSCALTELDLTRCTRLIDLRCSNNDLSELDLTRCTALAYVDVDGNMLRTLDLSANRQLKGLICDNNKLRELDLSACTGLASLDCYNNELQRLDLTYLRDLIALSCDGNRIVSLDISRNSALETLVCNGNLLTSITIGSGNTRLKYIHSSNNSLATSALNTVFEALPASGTIAIYANPGAATCDVTIAEKKNWTVMVR
jgi:hypothetical protein